MKEDVRVEWKSGVEVKTLEELDEPGDLQAFKKARNPEEQSTGPFSQASSVSHRLRKLKQIFTKASNDSFTKKRGSNTKDRNPSRGRAESGYRLPSRPRRSLSRKKKKGLNKGARDPVVEVKQESKDSAENDNYDLTPATKNKQQESPTTALPQHADDMPYKAENEGAKLPDNPVPVPQDADERTFTSLTSAGFMSAPGRLQVYKRPLSFLKTLPTAKEETKKTAPTPPAGAKDATPPTSETPVIGLDAEFVKMSDELDNTNIDDPIESPRTPRSRRSPGPDHLVRKRSLFDAADDDTIRGERKFFSCCPDSVEDTFRSIFREEVLPNCRRLEPSKQCAQDIAINLILGRDCNDDTSISKEHAKRKMVQNFAQKCGQDDATETGNKFFFVKVPRTEDTFENATVLTGDETMLAYEPQGAAKEPSPEIYPISERDQDGTSRDDTRTTRDATTLPEAEAEVSKAIKAEAKKTPKAKKGSKQKYGDDSTAPEVVTHPSLEETQPEGSVTGTFVSSKSGSSNNSKSTKSSVKSVTVDGSMILMNSAVEQPPRRDPVPEKKESPEAKSEKASPKKESCDRKATIQGFKDEAKKMGAEKSVCTKDSKPKAEKKSKNVVSTKETKRKKEEEKKPQNVSDSSKKSTPASPKNSKASKGAPTKGSSKNPLKSAMKKKSSITHDVSEKTKCKDEKKSKSGEKPPIAPKTASSKGTSMRLNASRKAKASNSSLTQEISKQGKTPIKSAMKKSEKLTVDTGLIDQEEMTDSEMPSIYAEEGMLVLKHQRTPSGLSNDLNTYITGDSSNVMAGESSVVVETVGILSVEDSVCGVESKGPGPSQQSQASIKEAISGISHQGFVQEDTMESETSKKEEDGRDARELREETNLEFQRERSEETRKTENREGPNSDARLLLHSSDEMSNPSQRSRQSASLKSQRQVGFKICPTQTDDSSKEDTVATMLREVRGTATYDSHLSREEATKREMENLKFKRRHHKNLRQRRGSDEIERARLREEAGGGGGDDDIKEVETYDVLDRAFTSKSSFDSIRSEKSLDGMLKDALQRADRTIDFVLINRE